MGSGFELTKHNDTIKYSKIDPNNPEKFISRVIPIVQLESIEIYGNIKFSTPLLKLCNKLKIPCYFNSYNGQPIGRFLPEKSKSSIIRLKQYETFLNLDKKLHIAKVIVKKASKERIRLIKKYDTKKKLKKKISGLNNYLKKINTTKSVNQLRGVEGNLMKLFFDSFSEMLFNLEFKRRSQRPPKDEANALLSFGNVILYNKIRNIIYKTALDPLVGFLHEPHENRNSLALDIAEIFRPIIIDNLILKLDHKKNILPHHFDKDEIKCYLNLQGKKIWLKSFNDFLQSSFYYSPLKRNISVNEEIKLECYNLIKYLTEQTKKYNPLDFNNP